MSIPEFFCAGCREAIDNPEVALALSPFKRKMNLLVLLHPNEYCAWRLHLNSPRWCPAPLDLNEPPTVDWCQRVGFEVTGWGDDRGFARAHYRGLGEAA